jgi:hypothetical protein
MPASPDYWRLPLSDATPGGWTGTGDGGVGPLSVSEAVAGWVDGDGGVANSAGAGAAACAGSTAGTPS